MRVIKKWRTFVFFFLLMIISSALFAIPQKGEKNKPADTVKESLYDYSSDSISPYGDYIPYYSPDIDIMAHDKTLWEKFIIFYRTSKPLARVLVFLTLFFFLNLILLLIVIFVHRVRDIANTAKATKLRKRYEDIIASEVFDEKRLSNIGELRAELKKPFHADVFLNELLSLHGNLSGESADNLRSLYIELELDRYSVKLAKSKRWHIKARGFRHVSQMMITDANDEIRKHLNSLHPILRMESRLAWIKLNPDNPLDFLDAPDVQITDWGKLNALATLMNNRIEIPSFERWMNSPNPKVAAFAVQMAGVFKHTHYLNRITGMLSHQDDHVRFVAIETLGKLGMGEVLSTMKNVYGSEVPENQLKIIEVIAEMGDYDTVDFFEQVIRTGGEKQKLYATRGLISLGNAGYQVLARLIRDGHQEIMGYITHLKDQEA